jgi:ubiquinone/menaquinone biosynthesis C-methylase UbiE
MRRPEFIAKQSRCPTGLLGWVIGRVMERETAAENDATLERLQLTPTDAVLEIGFGAGRALERVANVVTAGRVVGVEMSQDMLGMATRRCAQLIRAGRVELRLGAAEHLSFGAASFDKAYSVHTLYFWQRPAEIVSELRRVLRPDGWLVLCFRVRGAAGTADFPDTVYRFYGDADLVRLLRDGGFDDVTVSGAVGTPEGVHFAVARRP